MNFHPWKYSKATWTSEQPRWPCFENSGKLNYSLSSPQLMVTAMTVYCRWKNSPVLVESCPGSGHDRVNFCCIQEYIQLGQEVMLYHLISFPKGKGVSSKEKVSLGLAKHSVWIIGRFLVPSVISIVAVIGHFLISLLVPVNRFHLSLWSLFTFCTSNSPLHRTTWGGVGERQQWGIGTWFKWDH